MKFQDERYGKIVVVAHCILNQNSRVLGLARHPAVVDEVVDVLRRHNVGFLQIPCPELTYAGAKRPSRSREEYDTPNYRKHCRQIAVSTVLQLEEFAKNDIVTLAVLGIENSPSCGLGNSISETGILMEELLAELEKRSMKILIRTVKTSKIAADIKWLENILRTV